MLEGIASGLYPSTNKGALVMFGVNVTDAMCLLVDPDSAFKTSIWSKGINGKLDDTYIFESVMNDIRLDDVYISGTDLIFKFFNKNSSAARILKVRNAFWEVES
jgi:hypothetical protein